MSLRIAFLVQGEGRGHMTQALALRQILERRGHRVSRVVLSRSGRRPTPDFFLKKIHAPLATVESPEFVADRDDRAVRKLSTLTHNITQAPRLVGSIREIDEILGEIDKAAEMDVEDLEQQAKAVKDGIPNSRGADHAGDGA
jgi:UDP:flavonoid glycosyltransferase YjiC (YdhE family)